MVGCKLLAHCVILLAGQIAVASSAFAAGSTEAFIPTSIKVEGGSIFVTGSTANPSGCASASIVKMTPASQQEQDQMLSVLTTALVARKKVSLWIIGCTPSNWHPTIPQAVEIDIYG